MSRICVPTLRGHYHTLLTPRNITRCLHGTRAQLMPANKRQSSLESVKTTEVTTNVRPLGEKVKEAAKTTSYMSVILLGVGVTCAMFYTIFSELFSSTSPNNIYTKAFDRCISDSRVEDLLGAPIKGYGEESRRGRRGHVSHTTYEKNGKKYLRMRFYIKGCRNKATVHLEMEENSAGSFDYRYLIVQLDDYTRKSVVLENNTIKTSQINESLTEFI